MGKVIIISGASSGFGKETAELLSSNGHTVYGISRRGMAGNGVIGIALDVRDVAAIHQQVAAIAEQEGRIDVLIQTPKYVYIIELKRDKNPDDALDQIDEKGYDWPFLADDRKVFKIGANFSTKNHRLENWKLEE